MHALHAALFLATATTTTAWATTLWQTPAAAPAASPQKVDPALDLQRRANAALAALGPVAYRLESWAEFDGQREAQVADVVAGSPTGFEGMPISRPFVASWHAVVTEDAPPAPEVRATFDGRRLLHWMPEQETVWDLTFQPEGGFPVLPAFDTLLPGFQWGEHRAWDGATITLGEPVELDGRRCLVLTEHIEREDPFPDPETGQTPVSTTHREVLLDAETLLPVGERLESFGRLGDTEQYRIRGGSRLLGGLRPLEAEPADFDLPVPEGWELVDANPKERGLLLAAGDPAPAWTLPGFDGADHSLSDLRGRVVLLDFWATWCGPCLQAMPHLQDLHERLGERGLTVVGVSIRENEGADPKGLFAKRGFTYTGLERGEEAAEAYGVGGIPHLFLIDAEGVVRDQWVGFGEGSGARIEARILELLGAER